MTKDEELEQLRQENSALRDQVALLSERISVLEAKLAKDSHNSHLPPSSDRFQRQPKSLRKKSGKKPGGQAGHGGNTLKLSETPDQVIVHPVEHCQHCQRDLREVESLHVERRQVLDLPPKRVVVIEHQAQQKCCPTCHQISSAAFPQDVRAPIQYGAALGAVGVYLVQQQLLPYERASEVIEDLLGPPMSVGTLQGLVARCAEQLEPVEQQIKAALSRAEVLHQDETGLYVAGQRHWMHVSATEHLTHYAVHRKRRKESTARNLLDRLSKHQQAVLLFLDNFAVPFDNSLAERDIRMVKVQQKISGCFRSPAGAVAFCRIRGYLSTLRKQGMAVLTALEQTLIGHSVSPAF